VHISRYGVIRKSKGALSKKELEELE